MPQLEESLCGNKDPAQPKTKKEIKLFFKKRKWISIVHATQSVTLHSDSPSKLMPASSFGPLLLPSDETLENGRWESAWRKWEKKYTLGETTCLPKSSVSWPNIWEIFWGRPVWQILPTSPLPHGCGTYQPDIKLPASHWWLGGFPLMPETYFVRAQDRLKMSGNWCFMTHRNWSINTPAPSTSNMITQLTLHRLAEFSSRIKLP